jgi:hypothetical protein
VFDLSPDRFLFIRDAVLLGALPSVNRGNHLASLGPFEHRTRLPVLETNWKSIHVSSARRISSVPDWSASFRKAVVVIPCFGVIVP